jgi:hypothetical protein
MTREQELIERAVAENENAAGWLLAMRENGANHKASVYALRHARNAACAAVALECLMAGNPEPKRGD